MRQINSLGNDDVPLQGCQVRMARAALAISLTDLAEKSGVSEKTIRRVEQHCGDPPVSEQTLLRLRAAFETHGIRFIDATARIEGPGVRLDWDPNCGPTREDVLGVIEVGS